MATATAVQGHWFGLQGGTVAHYSRTNGHQRPCAVCYPRGFHRWKMADVEEVQQRPRCGKCERLLAFWERAGPPLSVA